MIIWSEGNVVYSHLLEQRPTLSIESIMNKNKINYYICQMNNDLQLRLK